MSTITKICINCEKEKITHEFQDRMYGDFQRIHNESTKFPTCTVCGSKITQTKR